MSAEALLLLASDSDRPRLMQCACVCRFRLQCGAASVATFRTLTHLVCPTLRIGGAGTLDTRNARQAWSLPGWCESNVNDGSELPDKIALPAFLSTATTSVSLTSLGREAGRATKLHSKVATVHPSTAVSPRSSPQSSPSFRPQCVQSCCDASSVSCTLRASHRIMVSPLRALATSNTGTRRCVWHGTARRKHGGRFLCHFQI